VRGQAWRLDLRSDAPAEIDALAAKLGGDARDVLRERLASWGYRDGWALVG